MTNKINCIILLLIFQTALLIGQPEDSLLGFASINEAYRSITTGQISVDIDKEFMEPLEVETIQQEVLAEGQALLEYFISDGKICVFYFSKNDFQKQIIPKDFPLETWVKLLNDNLVNPNFESADFDKKNREFIETAHLIYQKLFAPLEAFNLPNKLLIKSDGILKKLPFEIFLTAKPADFVDYENHDYLLKKYQISYCHSTMAHQKMMKQNVVAEKLFLTFAPADNENIQEEATAIYRKFGGDIYRTKEATEAIFKTEPPLFQAMHFPSICEQDVNKLPKLNAELVVFSNCEKGNNSYYLVEKLAEKNAKAIATNLWEINSEARLQFLKNFYHHIYQKKAKDVAMQKAKIDALRWTSGVEGHPHFWSGYVLFGVSNVVDLQGFRFDLWLWGALVLMLVFGVVFINKNII